MESNAAKGQRSRSQSQQTSTRPQISHRTPPTLESQGERAPAVRGRQASLLELFARKKLVAISSEFRGLESLVRDFHQSLSQCAGKTPHRPSERLPIRCSKDQAPWLRDPNA